MEPATHTFTLKGNHWVTSCHIGQHLTTQPHWLGRTASFDWEMQYLQGAKQALRRTGGFLGRENGHGRLGTYPAPGYGGHEGMRKGP